MKHHGSTSCGHTNSSKRTDIPQLIYSAAPSFHTTSLSTPPPIHSEVECEVLTLTKAVHQLKQELAIASEDKKLLISRNRSLMDDMKRHETITVSRHLTEVVALSIHALHHGYLLSKNSLSREQTSNFNSDSVHDMSICGGNERSHDPAEKRPYRMSSHNSIDKSLEASYDLSHDTARMNGGTPTLCKLKSERSCSSLSSSGSHDEDSPFVFGGSAVHHHNSRDDDVSDRSPQFTHLQWWMVDQSQYKVRWNHTLEELERHKFLFDHVCLHPSLPSLLSSPSLPPSLPPSLLLSSPPSFPPSFSPLLSFLSLPPSFPPSFSPLLSSPSLHSMIS